MPRIRIPGATVEVVARPREVHITFESIQAARGFLLTARKAREIAQALNEAADASASADGKEL